MARTLIPTQVVTETGLTDADVAYTAGDASNGMYYVNTGREVLLMTSSAGGKTATVVSVADENGRSGDKTLAPAAGKTGWFGPARPKLFNQKAAADFGRVHIDIAPDDTGVAFAVVQFVPADR